MAAIVSLLLVLALSLLVSRVGAAALELTGLSENSARFQARSAFTGVGFTTTEAESVVGHPVRRRIVMLLMLLGNAGIVTAVSTLMLSFVGLAEEESAWPRLLVLFCGVVGMWFLATSRAIDRHLSVCIQWALGRWTDLDVRDYDRLLGLSEDHAVVELRVEDGDWTCGRTLGDLELSREGVLVLGIHRRQGGYVGAPQATTVIEAGDRLILYGRAGRLEKIDRRSCGDLGDQCHRDGVAEQVRLIQEQAEEVGPGE